MRSTKRVCVGQEAKDIGLIRVNQLAKELGIPSKLILDRCKNEGLGLTVDTYLTKLSQSLADTIRGWFAGSQSVSATPSCARPADSPTKIGAHVAERSPLRVRSTAGVSQVEFEELPKELGSAMRQLDMGLYPQAVLGVFTEVEALLKRTFPDKAKAARAAGMRGTNVALIDNCFGRETLLARKVHLVRMLSNHARHAADQPDSRDCITLADARWAVAVYAELSAGIKASSRIGAKS